MSFGDCPGAGLGIIWESFSVFGGLCGALALIDAASMALVFKLRSIDAALIKPRAPNSPKKSSSGEEEEDEEEEEEVRTALSTLSRVMPVTNIERTEDRTGLARMASGPDKKRHNAAASRHGFQARRRSPVRKQNAHLICT